MTFALRALEMLINFIQVKIQFSVPCVGYYAKDIQDIKHFFGVYLDELWRAGKRPYNRMALYIENIADMDGWYDVVIGAALFNDDTIT